MIQFKLTGFEKQLHFYISCKLVWLCPKALQAQANETTLTLIGYDKRKKERQRCSSVVPD